MGSTGWPSILQAQPGSLVAFESAGSTGLPLQAFDGPLMSCIRSARGLNRVAFDSAGSTGLPLQAFDGPLMSCIRSARGLNRVAFATG